MPRWSRWIVVGIVGPVWEPLKLPLSGTWILSSTLLSCTALRSGMQGLSKGEGVAPLIEVELSEVRL